MLIKFVALNINKVLIPNPIRPSLSQRFALFSNIWTIPIKRSAPLVARVSFGLYNICSCFYYVVHIYYFVHKHLCDFVSSRHIIVVDCVQMFHGDWRLHYATPPLSLSLLYMKSNVMKCVVDDECEWGSKTNFACKCVYLQLAYTCCSVYMYTNTVHAYTHFFVFTPEVKFALFSGLNTYILIYSFSVCSVKPFSSIQIASPIFASLVAVFECYFVLFRFVT